MSTTAFQETEQPLSLDVSGGKYTFVLPSEEEWRVKVLRYQEPWWTVEQGHNAVHALVAEAIYMRNLLETLATEVDLAGNQVDKLAESARKVRALYEKEKDQHG